MRRRLTTLLGLAVVVLAVWVVAKNFRAPKAIGHAGPEPRDAADDGAELLYALSPDAGDDGPLLLGDLAAREIRLDAGGAGTLLLDGAVPSLPAGVPRQVRFGVVLVSYAGAQPSAIGGREASRSRAEAKTTADRLLATAQQDFRAAVQQGDAGSSDDVGRIKLGILEPAPEYVLFTLHVDEVGGPVETPRGFWIVKRLE